MIIGVGALIEALKGTQGAVLVGRAYLLGGHKIITVTEDWLTEDMSYNDIRSPGCKNRLFRLREINSRSSRIFSKF